MKITQSLTSRGALTLLLLLPALAISNETLPDSAPQEREDSQAMQDRFGAEAMSLEELEQLFLASPVELDTEEERSGGSAVSDQRGVEESIILQRERERERSLQNIEMPSRDLPPAPLPTYNPIRDL